MDDKNCIKDRILKDVGKSIKLIQQLSVGIENTRSYGISGSDVSSNSWLVQSLCCHLDLALRHGLRQPKDGFWPLLYGLSHSDTFRAIDGLQNINSALGKGLVWLHHTLMEGSLQSYLLYLTQDNTTLRRYYTSKAILRDHSCTQQLLTLLAGLENISFNMNPDGADAQETSGFSGLTSMTSSLSSPVDSGVALLDSDADITSTNEATVTEGDSVSLREEIAMLPELEDNRINDHIVSQEMGKIEITPEISSHSITGTEIVTSGLLNLMEENGSEGINANFKMTFTEHSNFSELVLTRDGTSGSEKKELLVNPHLLDRSSDDVSSNRNLVYNKCDRAHSNSCTSKQSDPIKMTESCMGLIEGQSYCTTEDPCKSDITVNNEWSHDPNSMSKSVGTDATVIRRQRNKNLNVADMKVKRVSFHEDLLMQPSDITSSFSASFLPPNPVVKCDAVKGRYSWCAEGDAPFFEQRKSENSTKSDVFLSSSGRNVKTDASTKCVSEEKLTSVATDNKLHEQVCESLDLRNAKLVPCRCPIETKLPPVTERGTPEGQEDPPKACSLLHLNSITDSVLKKFPSIASSIDWSSDTESDIYENRLNMKSNLALKREDRRVSVKRQSALLKFSNFMSPSKTSLFKKFMKSVTEKKNVKKKTKIPLLKPWFVPGAKPDPVITGQTLTELENIYSKMNAFVKSGCAVTSSFENTLKNFVFSNSKEVLYKVFMLNNCYFIDGNSDPLLIVLSENGIYFVGLHPNMSICRKLLIFYEEIESIIVGPRKQTILFVCLKNCKQMLVTSSSSVITGEIVAHIEIAMRRSPVKQITTLPAVSELNLDNMKTFKLQLSKGYPLLSSEKLHHYSIVHLQDNPTSPPSTPLGPKKEGHLMFRPATNVPLKPWEPGYFLLKGGVLYMFSEQKSRIPKRVIPLHSGQCHGCRRIPQETRPYTFEIILGYNRAFHFAAADEYETSEWLQTLIQSASGSFEMEQISTTPCSLVMTSHHIIACQESFPSGAVTILTCAAITDLMAVCVASADSSWCILEFACHEVLESSGDWAVYFSNSYEMMTFKQDLEILWNTQTQEAFPFTIIPKTSLRQRCQETSNFLTEAWDEILLADH